MNPFYGTTGESRLDAMKSCISASYKWAEPWYLVVDTVDGDWFSFGKRVVRKLSNRYKIIGITYEPYPNKPIALIRIKLI